MGKLKSIIDKIVPIHKHEAIRFICFGIMIVLVVYIHTIWKISKDALVISHLGTETISAIKIWVVTPMAAVFALSYIKMANNFNRSALFHILTWFFIGYFILFATVLYPNRDACNIDFSSLAARLPALTYMLKAVGSWQYSIFYLFSEMWVTMMLSISFWQIANHLVSVEESKRFYPLFGLTAQIGMMLAGIFSKFFVVHGSDWQPTLNNVTISIVISGVLLTLSFIALSRTVGTDVMNSKGSAKENKKSKYNISFRESLRYIASSKPVLLITAMLLSYNIVINLIEGVWKKSIEVYFSHNANEIQNFMSSVNVWVSIVSMVAAIACVFMLRHLKWRTSAMFTPAFTLVTGVIFFVFVLFGSFAAGAASALFIAILWGSVNNIFARATKHTLFDATKEMAYIPLDDELKTKGKAAAEMIGMRFGKGAGAFIQQGLLMVFTGMTLLNLAPVISVIFLVVIVCWIFSVIYLNRDLAGSLDAKK
ncbi:MAG: Npt1/Npt2 family nucleotide transporter [bacterium]